ncbi:MAG: 6-phosphofructokinase [bacterium]|jgi:6-phosphofructokinase 1
MNIGVLTSGGDCPGMNAAYRSVARVGLSKGHKLVAFKWGYKGLIDGDAKVVSYLDVADILQRGGTVLGSARSEEFETEEGRQKAYESIKAWELDCLIVIGGDGSLKGALALSRLGVRLIGIPKTIDNDVPELDTTIGFDTACNTVVDSLTRLRDTAASHHRAFIVETMGRGSGWLALSSGIAGGADIILIPEMPVDYDVIAREVEHRLENWGTYVIIVVAEGFARGRDVKNELDKHLKVPVDMRVTVLGHVQRGGSPTAFDRVLASRLGYEAVVAAEEGEDGIYVGLSGNVIRRFPLSRLEGDKRAIDPSLYELSRIIK